METTAQAEPDGTDRQVALLLAETMNSLVKGGPLRLPEGVEFTGAVQDRFLGIVLGAVRGLSHEHEDALRRELHDKGVYAPPCQDLAPAGDPGAGHPVVEEGFHSLHPEVGGWNMERWQLAVPGDGDDELGQFAASALQQHLLGAPDFGVGLERLRASTVTLHFFQQTGFDEDLGEESFQGCSTPPLSAGSGSTARSPRTTRTSALRRRCGRRRPWPAWSRPSAIAWPGCARVPAARLTMSSDVAGSATTCAARWRCGLASGRSSDAADGLRGRGGLRVARPGRVGGWSRRGAVPWLCVVCVTVLLPSAGQRAAGGRGTIWVPRLGRTRHDPAPAHHLLLSCDLCP